MSIPKKPRIVGFDLPKAGRPGEEREPIVAVLDVQPDPAWVDAFTREFGEVKASLGILSASVEGRSVFFGGFDGDMRRLSVQLRALVDRTTVTRGYDVREDNPPGGFGVGSFRRNN